MTSANSDTNANTNAGVMWRAMLQRDLPAVVAIAEQVHPAYPESPEVFAERLQLFAEGCRVAVDGEDCVHGYAITHPAMLGQPPALNSLLHVLPPQADCLYLHDVALTDAARRYGLGGKLVELIRQHAEAMQVGHAALVAVNDSAGYWRRRGFTDYRQADAALLKKIASYDVAAHYLVMDLARTV
ncbi:GNAT family N-acetyltransferase [Herbaspirillum rhizosphaerae]|uniref:GNAT family N-acetyltransferase n=1 Tax=Herbaspirillum rhizosphaerae TaxID=346179 RepID=UPI000A424EAD|nr:GNAT family N-acetyltransferase [Herbaspirillum rhizosphaerae]